MPVVGTSGHVDHGKTTLIAALTGVDTDRLPEEKARGMTTDLGFAHFADSQGNPVGIIDVPGHERYMRNMSAGAFGIDGAILVVAANDGWMEQTGRHLQILEANKVPILAVALTKVDLVAPDRVKEVGEDIARRLHRSPSGSIPGPAQPSPAGVEKELRRPAVCPVDAVRGLGLDELKSAVLGGLSRLGPRPFPKGPLLFIDRVFPLKGIGVVVAGSLRGGQLRQDDELFLYPSGEKLNLRGLQAYGLPVREAPEGSRVALALSRPRAEPHRGDCVASARAGIVAAHSVFLRTRPPQGEMPGAGRLRAGMEVELSAGTANRIATLYPSRVPGVLHLAWTGELALYRDETVIVLRHGGADILASGNIAAFGGDSAPGRRRIEEELRQSLLPTSPELSVPAKGTKLSPARPLQREVPPLSPSALQVLGQLRSAGEPGIDAETRPVPGLRADLSALCAQNLALSLDAGLFMETGRYHILTAAILRGRGPGSGFGIKEAKDATSLSRKWIIPLLNRMERDGYVKRAGDTRIVTGKAPGPESA